MIFSTFQESWEKKEAISSQGPLPAHGANIPGMSILANFIKSVQLSVLYIFGSLETLFYVSHYENYANNHRLQRTLLPA